MPYDKRSDLPEPVKRVLPAHAQDIYQQAFNHAWTEYKDPDDRRGMNPVKRLHIRWPGPR